MSNRRIKITNSSESRDRYTQRLIIPPPPPTQKEEEKSDVRIDTISKLKGHNKRNFWLDYPEEEFIREHNPDGLVETSEFKVKFAQHRELFFRQNEEKINQLCESKHLKFDLDCVNGVCKVSTTPLSFDPFTIIKGKLFLRLLCRGFEVEKASDVLLKDSVFCDIIAIKMLCKKTEIFKKRRKRLYGPNGSTIKAIELLTKTSMVIMGGTVSVVGSPEGCREVRKIVEDCMFNIHPIFRIKELMVIEKLKKDENMKNKDWSQYLPKMPRRNRNRRNRGSNRHQRLGEEEQEEEEEQLLIQQQQQQKRNKKSLKRKRSYFIPGPQTSKVDQQLSSGEFYFSQDSNKTKKKKRKF